MSLFKKVGRAIGGVARVAAPFASAIPGVGLGIGGALGGLGMLGARSAAASMAGPAIGAAFPSLGGIAARLGLGTAGGAVVAGGMAVARSGAAIARGAVTWCRRNPAWCANIGGTAAVAALIESGQLPLPRRRRGRGLSARDLRGFRKTTRLIRQVAGSVGIRRGRGRAGVGGAGGHTIVQN